MTTEKAPPTRFSVPGLYPDKPSDLEGFKKHTIFLVNEDGSEVRRTSGRLIETYEDEDGHMAFKLNTSTPPIRVALIVYKAFSGDKSFMRNDQIGFLDGNPKNLHFTNIFRIPTKADTKREKLRASGAPKSIWKAYSGERTDTFTWQRRAAEQKLEEKKKLCLCPDYCESQLERAFKNVMPGQPVPERFHDYIRVLYVDGFSVKDIAVLCKTRQGYIWEIVK